MQGRTREGIRLDRLVTVLVGVHVLVAGALACSGPPPPKPGRSITKTVDKAARRGRLLSRRFGDSPPLETVEEAPLAPASGRGTPRAKRDETNWSSPSEAWEAAG